MFWINKEQLFHKTLFLYKRLIVSSVNTEWTFSVITETFQNIISKIYIKYLSHTLLSVKMKNWGKHLLECMEASWIFLLFTNNLCNFKSQKLIFKYCMVSKVKKQTNQHPQMSYSCKLVFDTLSIINQSLINPKLTWPHFSTKFSARLNGGWSHNKTPTNLWQQFQRYLPLITFQELWQEQVGFELNSRAWTGELTLTNHLLFGLDTKNKLNNLKWKKSMATEL